MKPLFNFLRLPARILLLLSCVWISACREKTRQADEVDIEVKPTVMQQEQATDERISALEREIEEGRQNIENLEAFVQMERAKLEENPDYEQSFMQEALEKQQEIRNAVESGEKSLRELMPKKE